VSPLVNSERPRTVLIVDSDGENRDYLRQEFEAKSFIVLEAEDCRQTLDALIANQVGAVVLDLECSGRQREALMKGIQSEECGNPPVFMMVSPSVLSREQAYDIGAVGVMSKPVDPAYLIGRVSRLLTPAVHRWKKTIAPGRRHRLVASVFRPALGHGGFAVTDVQGNLIEGETVEFNVEVNDTDRWTLSGTGIVRYVHSDRRQRALGIEFESLDEQSMRRIIENTGTTQQIRYIPRFVS
jgi:DNA-binding response OmpR family regulator